MWIILGILGAVAWAAHVMWFVSTDHPEVSKTREAAHSGALAFLGVYVLLDVTVKTDSRAALAFQYIALALCGACLLTAWTLRMRKRSLDNGGSGGPKL